MPSDAASTINAVRDRSVVANADSLTTSMASESFLKAQRFAYTGYQHCRTTSLGDKVHHAQVTSPRLTFLIIESSQMITGDEVQQGSACNNSHTSKPLLSGN